MTNRSLRFLLSGLATVWIAACGGSSDEAASTPPASGPISQPTVLNLYPNQHTGRDALFTVFVTSVGSQPVSMPLGFDTGSAGVTLYAQSIFPASMVGASGFVFPAGQTSMTYNGITITNLQGARSYGTVNKTIEHGNLGFAELTFGDAQGSVTTTLMPVFLFYSVEYATGQGFMPPSWQGWFGVSSTADTIEIGASVEATSSSEVCTPQAIATCYVVSALKYIQYGAQTNAGFMLSPAPIQTCDITVAGSCTPAPMLTVGVNKDLEAAFSTIPMTCPPNGYLGPATTAGYLVCQKNIADITVASSGPSTGTFTGDAFFDTGTAYQYFSTPAGSSFPNSIQSGSTITVTTPSGFTYSYVSADTGTARTDVDAGAGGNSIIGTQFFTTNSFFIDFSLSTEGWK